MGLNTHRFCMQIIIIKEKSNLIVNLFDKFYICHHGIYCLRQTSKDLGNTSVYLMHYFM